MNNIEKKFPFPKGEKAWDAFARRYEVVSSEALKIPATYTAAVSGHSV